MQRKFRQVLPRGQVLSVLLWCCALHNNSAVLGVGGIIGHAEFKLNGLGGKFLQFDFSSVE
jgi:hypothetical protein